MSFEGARATKTADTSKPTIPHLPALDGLRALALASVLLFHAGGALPGGYLGVDLFFVLSGYLITSLLLAEREANGRVALGAFWIRRARRLLPALVAMVVAVAAYARFVADAAEVQSLRAEALATLGYVANWRSIFAHESYWQLFAHPSPLEHTWSLSIEEQFYFVWPLAVVLVTRRRGPRAVLALSLVGAALSMAAMIARFDPSDPSRAYLGTDARAAAILFGAALAARLPPTTMLGDRAVKLFDALGAASIAGLVVAWCTLRGSSPFLYRGGFWLTELAALALIVCAISGRRSLVARALSIAPLTALGAISYGVYLWHWPVFVALSAERTHAHGIALHVFQLVVTFAIAIASYRWFEAPIRSRGLRVRRPVFAACASFAASVAFVVFAAAPRPFPMRALPSLAETVARADAFADEASRFRVMVLGDSTANSLGWGLRGTRERGLVVDLEGQDGCTILMESGCHGPMWAERAKELQPNATLVFVGGAFLHGVSTDDGWREACHPGWNDRFERNLSRRLADLANAPGRVFAVTVPYPLGRYDDAEHRAEVDCINDSIRKSVAKSKGIVLLDLASRVCPNGVCERVSNGVEIRPDGVHYDMAGATNISRWVLNRIES